MGNVSRHRGPDDEGSFIDSHIALGMRRLSIIDVEGGHQPIANECESVWAVCNGEIYNFRELRRELEQKGHKFRSRSDSEVIVHLYEEYGDAFVTRMNGMFGFALWDSKRRRFLLGRDRLGIKPVYYRLESNRLIFASEAKSIVSLPDVTAELSEDALADYLLLGYVPAPYSLFRNIAKLPPASLMVCEEGRQEIKQFWFPSAEIDSSLSAQDWAHAMAEGIEKAVVAQMVSDVPLGAFLSGGIDSSSVVASMAKHSDRPVKTYSIGFADSSGGAYYNELPFARQVADRFGTEHREIVVEPAVAELLPRLIWHLDEPMADAAFVTTYLVSEFARQDVTVILSGVGGDELFGGYRRYLGEYYQKYYGFVPAVLRRNLINPLASLLPSDRHSPVLNLARYAKSFLLSSELSFEDRYLSYVGVFDREFRSKTLKTSIPSRPNAIKAAFSDTSGDSLRRMMCVDLATQMPDDLLMLTDRMSMATSLECRVPLLDETLVDLALRMPSKFKIHKGELKYVMKRALEDVLPQNILYRKKRGFGAPMGAWIKNELSSTLKGVLSRAAIERRGLFNWEAISNAMMLHETNRADYTDHLLSLMNLEIWCSIYLDGTSPEDISIRITEDGRA